MRSLSYHIYINNSIKYTYLFDPIKYLPLPSLFYPPPPILHQYPPLHNLHAAPKPGPDTSWTAVAPPLSFPLRLPGVLMAFLIIAIDQAGKLVILADKHNHNNTDPAAVKEIRNQGPVARSCDRLLDVHDFWCEQTQERCDGARVGEREDVFKWVVNGEDRGRKRVRGCIGGEGARSATGRWEVG